MILLINMTFRQPDSLEACWLMRSLVKDDFGILHDEMRLVGSANVGYHSLLFCYEVCLGCGEG